MASFCAYSAWYIFPRWKRPRAPLGRLIYGNTVSSCSPLISRSAPVARFSFPLILFSHMRSLCVSLAVSPCVSSHAFRCRCPSCRPSCRLIGSARFACRLVWAPFRSAVRSFSSRLSWRSCFAFPCRFVSPWHLVCHLVSSAVSCLVGSSRPPFRSVSPVGVSDPFSCLVLVFAPFCPARRSFLFVLFGIGSCSWSWGVAVRHGHGAAGACSSHLIRPIMAPCLWRFARCVMALWEDVGYGAPFRVARRSSLARSCPIVLFIPSDLPRPHCVLSFPHPRSKKAGSGSGGEGGIEQER